MENKRVRLIGFTLFEDGEHARYETVPQRYIFEESVYQALRRNSMWFSANLNGPFFDSLLSAIRHLKEKTTHLNNALNDEGYKLENLFVPINIDFLKYTGLDTYITSLNSWEEIIRLPHMMDTPCPYYSAFTGKNGPIEKLPIVLVLDKQEDEHKEGVIGTVGLVDVMGL